MDTETSLERICELLQEIDNSLVRMTSETYSNCEPERLDDKFAMAAMAALIARSDGEYDIERIAATAYKFANAMVGEKQESESDT